ncbi:MAG: TonB-dependent receptor, partial [Kordiimonadaceae bacterium]|nr:TonB-dependent receptor [Kordiimonadaceae bacterium]
HSSKLFFDPANISSEDAFGVLNANIEVFHADNGVSVMFWGKNLLDKDYIFSQIVSVPGIGGAWADPISYGVRLKYQFN